MNLETLRRASLLLIGSAASLSAQAYRVGTPFAPRVTVGRVDGMVSSPDGIWTVYVGDQRSAGVREIFSVRSDGSEPPRRLNRSFVAYGAVQVSTDLEWPDWVDWTGFQVTADSTHVVYRADAEVDGCFELFGARIDGEGVRVRLNPPLGAGETVYENVLLAPGGGGTAGGCVVFGVKVGFSSHPIALYTAPVDGSSPARRIDEGTTSSASFVDFDLSPDGTCLAYVAHASALYRAPLDGSSAPLLLATGATEASFSPDGTRIVYRESTYPPPGVRILSVPSTGGASTHLAWNASDFQITPDSGHVVYRIGETAPQLWCVPITGGAVRALSASGGQVWEYTVQPGSRVVFRGTQSQGQGLYSVPVASGGPQRISAELAPSTGVYDFLLSPDGATALYTLGTYEERALHSVAVDGSSSAVELASSVEEDYRFTPDGACAFYRGGQGQGLYRRPIDASAAAVRLDPPEPAVPMLSFDVDPTGERVCFRRETPSPAGSHIDLYSVRVDASEIRRLNRPLASVSLATVTRFRATADGRRCVYLADAEKDDVFELWSSSTRPGSTSVRLNDPLVDGGNVQTDFVLTPDQSRVVYRADRDDDERFELYASALSGGEPAVALAPGFPPDRNVVAGHLVDPTGQYVVFRANYARPAVNDLYVVSLDGAHPPERRNTNADSGVGAPVRIVDGCLLYLGRRSSGNRFDLYRVPLDGSSAPVVLSEPPTVGGGLLASYLLVTPDGERAIYLSAHTNFSEVDLFSVRVDGSGSPRRLNASNSPLMGAGMDLSSLQLDASGTHVLYELRLIQLENYRLHSVPVDGSADPVVLAHNLTWPTDCVPTGSVVVVRRDDHLEVIPVDGSAPPLALTAIHPDLTEFVVTPDGTWVIYGRGGPFSGSYRLDRVRTAGGSPPEQMLGSLPGTQVRGDFRVSPDGRRLVFKGQLGSSAGLFSRSIEGNGLSAWIGNEVDLQEDPLSFEISANSRLVLFQRATGFQTDELFATGLAPERHSQASGPE